MTTLLTISLITIAVAFCNYKHAKLMKEHNQALNSYYQNKMIEEAKRYRTTSIALSIIAALILIAQLFGAIQKKNEHKDAQLKTTTHYDTNS